jgi:hypothetical protein
LRSTRFRGLIPFVTEIATLSLTDRFTSLVEGLMNDVEASVVWHWVPIPLIKLLWRRLRRMKARFASIMARFDAGTLPAPVVRAATRFQRHHGRRQLGKEIFQSGALEAASQRGPFVLAHATHGENGLGRIQANALKVHQDGPPGCGSTTNLGTRCRGGRPPQQARA